MCINTPADLNLHVIARWNMFLGRNLITRLQQKTAVSEHETTRSWSHCGSKRCSSWSNGSSTNVAFSFLTDCLKKGYPNEDWIQIGIWISNMIGIRFHPLQTSMKHLDPWGPTLETRFLCASFGTMDRRGNILKIRTWASKRISKRGNKYVLERKTWENKSSYSKREYDKKLGFTCVCCLPLLNQSGREVLSIVRIVDPAVDGIVLPPPFLQGHFTRVCHLHDCIFLFRT